MKQPFDYAAKKAELDSILVWLGSGEADVAQSLAKFDQAKKLLDELEAYLRDTEAKLAVKVQSLHLDSEE